MTPEKLLDRQLGPYKIEAILGSGGMAVVYRAKNTQGDTVALKVLFPPPDAAAELRRRFEREARTAARLRHPGIVRVLDAGQADGYAYMAMSFVSSQTIAGRLAETAPLPETVAADIAWQMADALYYAHTQGVVHRDVKPSNILLMADGRALLTDFGVAQALDDASLTRTGHTVGTPVYMAPEQASGEQAVDGRADLYSLGVVLYQMVTGRTPFQGSTPQVLYAHVYAAPPPPSSVTPVSPAMESIILKALQKDASNRYQTGAAMAQALANFSDGTGTHARLPVPPPTTKRHRAWLGAIILLLLVVILAGIWQFGFINTADAPIAALNFSPTVAPTHTPTGAPSATVTATPSATPSPLATETRTPVPPPPTDTPTTTLVPSLTFTPVPPPPPATHTPTVQPTATPCPNPINPAFAGLIQNNSTFGELLGCPLNEAVTIPAAWQPFEQGDMLWRGDSNQIYILEANNSWRSTGDTWREGDAEPVVGDVPDGMHQPVRGFGKVWFEQPGVRESLGWGVAQEDGFEALVQDFMTGGQIWQDPERGTIFVLLNDRTFREF